MQTSLSRSRRGGALVAVLIVGLALLIICGALLRNALTERKLNARTALRLQTYGLAEAAVENAVAQARHRIEQGEEVTNRGSLGGFSALPFGPSFSISAVSPQAQVEARGGLFNQISNLHNLPTIGGVPVRGSSPNSYYYDPTDPANEQDPVKGRWLFRYDLPLFSRATVPLPAGQSGPPVTVCLQEVLSIRSIPIFAYAVFYNMDLEVNPGPQMDIFGNVHANGRLFARVVSNSPPITLNFHGQVSVTGGFYADFKEPEWSANGTPNTGGTADTRFTRNIANDTLGGVVDGSTWRDHKWGQSVEDEVTIRRFRDWSRSTFRGNLQTSAHGVQVVNLAAMGEYVEDPTPGNGVDDSVNEAHQLIEPASPGGDRGVEIQKYSTRSGIYIVANPSAVERTGHAPGGFAVTVPPRQYRVYTRGGNELILPGQLTYGPGAFINRTPNAAGPAVVTIRPAQMYDIRRGTVDWTRPRSASNAYVPRVLDLIDLDMTALKLAVDKSVNGLARTSVYGTAVPPDRTSVTHGAWTSFIYNSNAQPSSAPLTNAHRISYAPGPDETSANPFNPDEWNGAIYVESIDAPQRKDSGVRLINSRGRLASNTAGDGLTIATNDALYLLGHYNADGTIGTSGTGNSARYPENAEAPCSVASDSITVLSQPSYTNNGTIIAQQSGWNDALSFHRMADANSSYMTAWQTTPISNRSNSLDGVNTATQPWRVPYDNTSGVSGTARTAKFPASATELATAMLTGIVPSNKDGTHNYSGGLHNYPRFLESHAGATLAIRGSLVALFESRVATQPWSVRHYSAPTRLWGFNELFNQGKFPPLTPRLLSFRRANFREIPPGQYNQLARGY